MGTAVRWRVVKPCVVQATGQRHEPGDLVECASAFDIAHLTAQQCIVPHTEEDHETATVVPYEKRRGGWKRK